MQQCVAFKSGALSGRNVALRASGVRPARAAASRLVVQARQKEAGVDDCKSWVSRQLGCIRCGIGPIDLSFEILESNQHSS